MNHRADEPELLHRAHEFLGRGIGRLHRQGREAAKPGGMAFHDVGQIVIELTGHDDAILAADEIGARAAVRQDGKVDAGFVHRFEALLADLGQQFERIRTLLRQGALPKAAAGDDGRVDAAGHRRYRKMLLKGNRTHRRCLSAGFVRR